MRSLALDYIREKGSNLCVGLDPRGPGGVIGDPDFDRVGFMEYLIEETGEFAAAFKVNRQFVLGLSSSDLLGITRRIHDVGSYAIIDHKVSDIGSSNRAAFVYSKLEGFDAITISPYPGNFVENFEMSEDLGIELIYLLLMSNPDANWVKRGMLDGTAMHVWFASQIGERGHGFVIGTTGHIVSEDLEQLSGVLPDGSFILAPGIGSQGGMPDRLVKYFGDRVLFSASRSIANAESPSEAASQLLEQIGKLL